VTELYGDIAVWLALFLSGIALGFLYFTGLWLSVRYLVRGRRPALFMFASLAVRLGVLLGAFFLVARSGRFDYVLPVLVGFVAVRAVMLRKYRPGAAPGHAAADPGVRS